MSPEVFASAARRQQPRKLPTAPRGLACEVVPSQQVAGLSTTAESPEPLAAAATVPCRSRNLSGARRGLSSDRRKLPTRLAIAANNAKDAAQNANEAAGRRRIFHAHSALYSDSFQLATQAIQRLQIIATAARGRIKTYLWRRWRAENLPTLKAHCTRNLSNARRGLSSDC